VIVPVVVPEPEPPAAESHAPAWAVAGAAAAGLAHVITEEERETPPKAPAVPVYVPPAMSIAEAAPEIAAAAPSVEEAVASESSVEEAVEALPPVGEAVETEIAAAVGGSDSEVVLTPQVLEEPLPGSGWEPSAVFVEEEMELEELLPVVADDVRPYEGPEVPPVEPRADEEAMPAAWSETLAVPEGEALQAASEDLFLEAVAAEELAPPVSAEVPVAAAEPPAASAEIAAVPAEAAVPEEEAVGEDLKSRIEETRRRIREELERPFAVVDEEGTPAVVAAPPAAVVAASVGATIVPSPSIQEPVLASAEAIGTVAGGQPTAESAPGGNGSDYDAMRARIELTRSRLKAKAFDAMMAGESTLLRRDPEGSSLPQKTVAVDSEIEQTVESTLREEDD
jgi:hypothetical protein